MECSNPSCKNFLSFPPGPGRSQFCEECTPIADELTQYSRQFLHRIGVTCLFPRSFSRRRFFKTIIASSSTTKAMSYRLGLLLKRLPLSREDRLEWAWCKLKEIRRALLLGEFTRARIDACALQMLLAGLQDNTEDAVRIILYLDEVRRDASVDPFPIAQRVVAGWWRLKEYGEAGKGLLAWSNGCKLIGDYKGAMRLLSGTRQFIEEYGRKIDLRLRAWLTCESIRQETRLMAVHYGEPEKAFFKMADLERQAAEVETLLSREVPRIQHETLQEGAEFHIALHSRQGKPESLDAAHKWLSRTWKNFPKLPSAHSPTHFLSVSRTEIQLLFLKGEKERARARVESTPPEGLPVGQYLDGRQSFLQAWKKHPDLIQLQGLQRVCKEHDLELYHHLRSLEHSKGQRSFFSILLGSLYDLPLLATEDF